MTTREFFSDKVEIVNRLDNLDRASTVKNFAALLTFPAMHGWTFALELLIHASCAYSSGTAIVTREEIRDMLLSVSTALADSGELPRDLFVVNVMTGRGNRKLLTGTWEMPDFWVQHAMDALRIVPPRIVRPLQEDIYALLDVSDTVLEKLGLSRYQAGMLAQSHTAQLPGEDLIHEAEAVLELSAREQNSETFTIAEGELAGIEDDPLGNSRLERRPIISFGNKPFFAMPTAVSAAIRMHLIQQMKTIGQLEPYATAMKMLQTSRLNEDVLRRLKSYQHPVHQVPQDMRFARQTVVEFETGKIAQVLYLNDEDSDLLDRGLTSFNTAGLRNWRLQFHLARFIVRARFVGHAVGMTIVVMGGFGRGFALPIDDFCVPDWPVYAISLADAIAFSWLEDNWCSAVWRCTGQSNWLSAHGLFIDSEDDLVRLLGYWIDKLKLVPADVSIPSENVTAKD
ncbi:MAG TPA: hypothetical protein VFB04_00910 [Terriglobales bacterium]|nr:hypothetical protein [Terriglobales bacterium]